MKIHLLLLAALSALAMTLDTDFNDASLPSTRRCKVEANPAIIKLSQQASQQELASIAAGSNTNPSLIVVNTYFHIIADAKNLTGGWVPQKMVDDQIATMNKAYAPQNVTFKLIKTDWTLNQTWAIGGDEIAMANKLRKGGYRDLNLYFLKSLPDNVIGYCYFPIYPKPQAGSFNMLLDGCKVVSATMPGGNAGPFSLGMTAVHEIGHWFGLMHPFQGNSCSGPGDYVDDTPIQLNATAGCPAKKDSCPTKKGLDNIHNYMDYSYDSCYTLFTKGQTTRMHGIFDAYRK